MFIFLFQVSPFFIILSQGVREYELVNEKYHSQLSKMQEVDKIARSLRL